MLEIFKGGLSYTKAGVMALGITHENDVVRDLFSHQNDTQIKIREKLLFKFDQLNRRFDQGTLKFASEGT